jgi:hypothetical protein
VNEITANKNVDNTTINVEKSIWAHNNISSTSTSIENNGNVTFMAGNSINLQNGFKAKLNSSFNAKINKFITCTAGTFKSTKTKPSGFIYERNILDKNEENKPFNLEHFNSESHNISDKNISIFPNPTTGIINISQSASQVELHSLTGELLMQAVNKQKIDISEYPNGVYILKVMADEQVITEKIIKE